MAACCRRSEGTTLTSRLDLFDHHRVPLVHDRVLANGVRLHIAAGGSGPPVYLIHGTPKTMCAWRHVIPLLTPYFRVTALDCRGYGESERPADGYDTTTMARDVHALADACGDSEFALIGEDWGAAVALAAAAMERQRVSKLIFQEMRVPGVAPDPPAESYALDDTRSGWHFRFFSVPGYPELLMPGREHAFWTTYMRNQAVNPTAIADEDIDHVVDWIRRPNGLRTVLSVYRATDKAIAVTRCLQQEPLDLPVLAVGGAGYLGHEVLAHLRTVATNVRGAVIDGAGHNPMLEAPRAVAEAYLRFLHDG